MSSPQTVRVPAEWQPALTCFCPVCKLHINLLRVEPTAVHDTELQVGAACQKELLTVGCPNCSAILVVDGVKAGGSYRLRQLLGEGRAETTT